MSKIILCADDSVTMQKVAEITFRATEYSYVGAQNADDALAKARQSKPAIVLADASMPGKDGYDLCKAIKAEADLAGVPVVLLCGKSQAYDSDRGAASGADGHLTKPWDTQVMIDKIAEILAKGASAPAATATKPAAAAAPTPAPTPAAKPAAPAMPKIPSIPTQSPTAARSATIMGMPSIKPPMKSPAAPGVTPISSSPSPVAAPKPPAPSPAPPRPAPVEVKPPAAPKPAAPAAAPAPASAAVGRPPMIRGIPTKRLKPISAQVASKVAAAAADVARDAGLDPSGPEMQALMQLSADVIERIAWEVIPQLAEAMLRENLHDLAAKQQ